MSAFFSFHAAAKRRTDANVFRSSSITCAKIAAQSLSRSATVEVKRRTAAPHRVESCSSHCSPRNSAGSGLVPSPPESICPQVPAPLTASCTPRSLRQGAEPHRSVIETSWRRVHAGARLVTCGSTPCKRRGHLCADSAADRPGKIIICYSVWAAHSVLERSAWGGRHGAECRNRPTSSARSL